MLKKAEKFFAKEYRMLTTTIDNKPEIITTESCWYAIQRCYAVYLFALDLIDNGKDIDELDIIYRRYFEKFKELFVLTKQQ
jgi:hypothetical protein